MFLIDFLESSLMLQTSFLTNIFHIKSKFQLEIRNFKVNISTVNISFLVSQLLHHLQLFPGFYFQSSVPTQVRYCLDEGTLSLTHRNNY
jgi:hypothetical protein